MEKGSKPRPPAGLEQYFDLTTLEKDLFLPSYIDVPPGARGAFGGHLVSLALTAASKTVEDDRFLLHSVHSHFISSCRAHPLPVFHVERTKDGKTFSNRGVKVTQNGRTVFHALVSFYGPEPVTANLVHNDHPMPLAPPQDSSRCVSKEDLLFAFLRDDSFSDVSDPVRMKYCMPPGWENLSDITTPLKVPQKPMQMMWVKALKRIESTDQNVHRTALAFASDYNMPWPIRLKYPQREFSLVTSLDHTIWFHKDIDFNKWHLHVLDCQSAVGGTSINVLRVFAEGGELLATVTQQAFYRAKL